MTDYKKLYEQSQKDLALVNQLVKDADELFWEHEEQPTDIPSLVAHVEHYWRFKDENAEELDEYQNIRTRQGAETARELQEEIEEMEETIDEQDSENEKLKKENETIEEKVRSVGHQPTIDACLHTWYGEESEDESEEDEDDEWETVYGGGGDGKTYTLIMAGGGSHAWNYEINRETRLIHIEAHPSKLRTMETYDSQKLVLSHGEDKVKLVPADYNEENDESDMWDVLTECEMWDKKKFSR